MLKKAGLDWPEYKGILEENLWEQVEKSLMLQQFCDPNKQLSYNGSDKTMVIY